MVSDLLKVFFPLTLAFFVGLLLAPALIRFLRKHEIWKRESVGLTLDGKEATISKSLHRDEDRKVPRMGGLLVILSASITLGIFYLFRILHPGELTNALDFLSRNQTWLPFFVFLIGGLIGLLDDFFVTRGFGGQAGGGISPKYRIFAVIVLASFSAYWFMEKLGVSSVLVPFWGELEIGYAMYPLFILVMLAIFSGGVIDGIDGLSGGVLAAIFGAYTSIAFFNGQYDLAAFTASVTGGLFAFLWFNVPPAQFYMSEVGMLALTTTITVVAFLTGAVLVLPIIAFPLLLASGSTILQVLSKKFRNGKKIFLVAPVHHHFQALGWPGHQVTMRFWIVSVISALLGTIIHVAGLI